MTVNLLRESFDALKKNAAHGVDGVTWRELRQGWKLGSPIYTTGSTVARPGHALHGE